MVVGLNVMIQKSESYKRKQSSFICVYASSCYVKVHGCNEVILIAKNIMDEYKDIICNWLLHFSMLCSHCEHQQTGKTRWTIDV